ncbi:hypothetical protein ES705_16607 [subsurface metagenome]
MAKSENIILTKSYEFALKIVKLYKKLVYNQKEFDLSRQLLRSGTSIGSNAEEATGAQSRKDFIAKFSIAYKESRETKYWLRLLRDSEIIESDSANELITDCEEIQKIITSILKTTKAS